MIFEKDMTKKHPGRVSHCPVCNGKMEYKAINYWSETPLHVCSRCGYSGSFTIEWDDEDRMADYTPKNWKENRKTFARFEDEKLRRFTLIHALCMIITYTILIVLLLAGYLGLF